MADLDESVLEILEGNRSADSREFVTLLERHHDGPGVDRDVVEAYLSALASDPETGNVDRLRESVEDRIVDGEGWVDDRALYRLDGDRVSTFPARWHDELGGTDDLLAYVRFIIEEVGPDSFVTGGAGRGIPEQVLLDAAEVVGGLDREEAKERLQRRRDAGDLAEDVDQHPAAEVYPTEDDSAVRDESLDG